MRNELIVRVSDEIALMAAIGNRLQGRGLDASNSVIVTVSSDYSSCLGMWLRHFLSKDGEICEGISIEVPYPDEKWEGLYNIALERVFRYNIQLNDLYEKTLVLVEAGVIKGGTYYHITKYIRDNFPKTKIVTVAMFENVSSKFKSDIVGRYYDNDEEDLTFWWEQNNKHWN